VCHIPTFYSAFIGHVRGGLGVVAAVSCPVIGAIPLRRAIAPGDDTVVCRCEDVTAGEIRSYAKLGCLGPNRTKARKSIGARGDDVSGRFRKPDIRQQS